MSTRFVVVAMTFNREHAERQLDLIKSSMAGAEIVELADGDALVRASDARAAIDGLVMRRTADWPLAPSSHDELCVCGRTRDSSVHADGPNAHPFQPRAQ